MNLLETSLINLARDRLTAVLDFYASRQAGTATKEDDWDFMANSGALTALLELGHFSSGMTADGAQVLLKIEAEHAAAVRLYADEKSEPDALAILISSFGDEEAAPKLTDFFVTVYADKCGEAPTQAQRDEIEGAVTAMVQFHPSQRTVNHFVTLLRDSDVIFACSSALGDSEAVARYV